MDKIINLLINNWTKGVDTYTHNGSTWLIFTEQKSWVIELTESKTLWYNYNFFRELFSLTSMDVVENQHYITKWVEDNIINKVNYTSWGSTMNERFVGDVIEDGVKETFDFMEQTVTECDIDNIIQNGIKETHDDAHNHKDRIDGVIKNGVKETKYNQSHQEPKFKEVLKNGIKETNHIKNNVRETKHFEEHLAGTIDSVIDNGKLVSETFVGGIEQIGNVNTVLNCGIKETKTPGKDGDILSTIEWMDENKTNSVPKLIDNVIEKGEKINGIFVGGKIQKENIEVVIDYGVKQTKPIGKESPNHPKVVINHIIQNGTKNPSV